MLNAWSDGVYQYVVLAVPRRLEVYTGGKTDKWRSYRIKYELYFSLPNERTDSVDEHSKQSHIMHERTHKGRQLEVSLPSPRAVI